MSALRKEVVDIDYGQELNSPNKKRIKRNKKNNNVIESIKNTFMLAITFVLGIMIVYNYAIITDKQMEIHTLSKDIINLNNDIAAYEITLEGIKNTNSIEELAKTYLGMNYPTRKQTVFVDFKYGSPEETQDEAVKAKEKGQNILLGIVDKVASFIQ